jgi:hypothetical protein
MNLKCKVEPIDDGQFLATVQGSNAAGEKHGNLGKVCDSLVEAIKFVHSEINVCVDKLGEKTAKLPFDKDSNKPKGKAKEKAAGE